MKWTYTVAVCIWLLTSCSPRAMLMKRLTASETQFKDHIGFIVFDPGTRKTLLDFNSGKYFTPASNTKIFTFYSALQILGDSVPALKYVVTGDSLIFWGTGDPSFLYREVYDNQKVYQFLKTATQRLFYSPVNFHSEHFGPGWAWDDFVYAYSAERSSFPAYGNLIEVEKITDQFVTRPSLFAGHMLTHDSILESSKLSRELNSNELGYYPGKTSSNRRLWKLPFHVTQEVTAALLSDTLKKKVSVVSLPIPKEYLILKSIPTDSLLKVMMQKSDNFIAEQLLLSCADALSDSLDSEIAIRYVKKNFLFDLPDEPVWVDGSGLSRYNLFTPRSIVRLWEKIYIKVPQERLFGLLAAGSQNGTLKNWYVFGKTGSLSNNHTLSGFLITRKNKILIFSFMNTDFTVPSEEIRTMMQEILLTVRNEF